MRPANFHATGVVLLRKPLGKNEVKFEEDEGGGESVGAASIGLIRASLGDRAVCVWCLAVTITTHRLAGPLLATCRDDMRRQLCVRLKMPVTSRQSPASRNTIRFHVIVHRYMN